MANTSRKPRGLPTPIAIEKVSLVPFLEHIIDHHKSPTTLIICSSREAFIQELLLSTQTRNTTSNHERNEVSSQESEEVSEEPQTLGQTPPSHLLIPTLHLLSTTRSVNLAFTPDLPHLLAYLSLLEQRADNKISKPEHGSRLPLQDSGTKVPILAILNPIALHKSTSSFSVQGLNRTLAAAVETAHLLGRELVIAECEDGDRGTTGDARSENEMNDAEESSSQSPWDEEVSMLNVTTKTFGAGEKGWVGRTVPVRRIVGRWCRFVDLETSKH